ncbi:MAG: hypothetical protein JJ992_10040, partial [Planctomycetes bacterium]|nr:hypothetical protein [Planctomycetota bacterium]
FGARYLYLWARPDMVAVDPKLQAQQWYLNLPFFCLRAAICFAVWLTIAFFLRTWSHEEDQTGESRFAWRNEQLSGPGLVMYGITIHFAAIDWLMSLEPLFPSTIFGPVVAAGQFLSALAFAVLAMNWLAKRSPVAEILGPKTLNDLGTLLLALLVVWTYLVWFQFMLVWIANLPEDVIWYLPRFRGGWLWVVIALVFLQFTIPFFLLLMTTSNHRPYSYP